MCLGLTTNKSRMRILLDTYYLFGLMERGEFSSRQRSFFNAHQAELYASAASIWEMRLKYLAIRRGKRQSPHDPMKVVDLLDDLGIPIMTITGEHAKQPLATPLPHNDPFDELLVVQAQVEGFKLLTVDRQLVDHPLAITVP